MSHHVELGLAFCIWRRSSARKSCCDTQEEEALIDGCITWKGECNDKVRESDYLLRRSKLLLSPCWRTTRIHDWLVWNGKVARKLKGRLHAMLKSSYAAQNLLLLVFTKAVHDRCFKIICILITWTGFLATSVYITEEIIRTRERLFSQINLSTCQLMKKLRILVFLPFKFVVKYKYNYKQSVRIISYIQCDLDLIH